MSEWDFVKLGSLAHFKNGLNFSKDSWGKGIKIIGVSDFKDYLYPRYETLAEINPNGVVRKGNYLEEDDILFVRSNGNRLQICSLKSQDEICGTIFVRDILTHAEYDKEQWKS